jgi:threonine/homoserine/homoserine lactone efflux protein
LDTHLFRTGFVLGLAVAAPVGAIGTLVIRRSLAHGALAGLSTGLGAAVADAAYAAVAALGIAAHASAVTASLPFHLAAAALLAWLGVSTMRPRPPAAATDAKSPVSHPRAFGSTLLLTLANPSTIASFAAASTAIGVQEASPRAAFLLAGAVLAGSATWWLLLSTVISSCRTQVGPRALRAVDIGAGAALLGFAAMALPR